MKKRRMGKLFLFLEAVLLAVLCFLLVRFRNEYLVQRERLDGQTASGAQTAAVEESDAPEDSAAAVNPSSYGSTVPEEREESAKVISEANESAEDPLAGSADLSTAVSSESSSAAVQADYITDLYPVSAGTVLGEEQIDAVHLDQYFKAYPITEGDQVYNRIIGRSYVPNDDIALSDLRYLKLLHRNYDSQPQVGELIVNVKITEDILYIFKELYLQNYQVFSMHLVDDYWVGDGEKSDTASIEVDNTSAFSYRFITGSDSQLSNHAYGCAIDLNPMENPYVKVYGDGSKSTYHENAQGYVYNRTSETPHVIDENDLAYKLFAERGFSWGGHWKNPIDYQHFEKKF